MFHQLIFLCLFVLLSVAFFSLFERNLMGLIQWRVGPCKVGFIGILQPIADAIKLILKVQTPPNSSISFVFFSSPIFFFFFSLLSWVVYSSEWILLNFPKGVFFLLISYSLSVYGIVFSGWFSNSKYSLLGSGRAFAQSISYEIGLTSMILFLSVYFCSPSLEFFANLQRDLFLLFPFAFIFFMFLISMISELNRSPFDLAEGESELVSGYSVEYGGLSYTLIFLSENISLIWASYIVGVFFMKEVMWVLIFFFVWIRASMPRVRFDKMMWLFWVSILPLVMAFFLLSYSLPV